MADSARTATLGALVQRIEAEARREPFPIDLAQYERSGRDPYVPILYAGNLDAPVAFFGRDLGATEVMLGEPLIGDAGRRVRRALYRAAFHTEPPAGDPRLHEALARALLTNTVPYKPPGNKAYSTSVKERFRPYVAELLACNWRGDLLVTLGSEAFHWFAPYAGRDAIDGFWRRPDRFSATLSVTMEARCPDRSVRREIALAPLPHPSPLNQVYLAQFPGLLDARLRAAEL